MDWTSPFIIYRINAEGKLEEVFHAADIQKAKYWLSYIAQPGDVLCRTPAHQKHTKSSPRPEYAQHKADDGKPSSEQEKWQTFARHRNCEPVFPEQQYGKISD